MLIAFVVFLEKRKIQFIVIWKSVSKISWTTIANISDFCIVTRPLEVQSIHVKTDIGKPINKSMIITFWLVSIVSYPGPRGFFLIFFSLRDWERASRRGEKEKNPWFQFHGLEAHFHANHRVRIWPSGLIGWYFKNKTKQINLIDSYKRTIPRERQLLKYCIGNLCKRCILLHIHFQD